MTVEARPVRRIGVTLVAVAVVGAAWMFLQLTGLGRTPFYTKGEPREAVVVQDLVANGNWVLPRRNGVELPRKPPLFYWLAGIAAHARGGVDEASVRLPSAIMSGAAALLVAGVAAALYGVVGGVVTGVTLLTSFEWMRAASAARVDMTLAFGLTLSFVGLLCFRRFERGIWLLLFYAGAAWATLSKGIPGLAIPALQVVLLCLLVDRSLAWVRRLHPVLGLVAVLLITGAWYAAASIQGGRAFVSIVARENLVRITGATRFTLGHQHSAAYLLGMLVVGLLPWTLLLPSTVLALWRDRARIDRTDPRLFALIWIAAVFVPYAIATSKRGVYLLPLYPAVALLLGWWASELVRGTVTARWLARPLAAAAWLLALVLALLAAIALAQAVGLPVLDTASQFFDPRTARDLRLVAAQAPWLSLRLAAALAVAAAAAVALACTAGLHRWAIALGAMVVCTAAVISAVHLTLPAIAEGETRRPLADALRRVPGLSGAVHTGPNLDYGLIYYWGAPIPVYESRYGGPPPSYLLVPDSVWRRMSPAERRAYHQVPLTIEPGRKQGYPILLQLIDEPSKRTADS